MKGMGGKRGQSTGWRCLFLSGTGCHCTVLFHCTILLPYKIQPHAALGYGRQFWSLPPRNAVWSQRRRGEEQLKWPKAGATTVEGEGKMAVLLLWKENIRNLYRLPKSGRWSDNRAAAHQLPQCWWGRLWRQVSSLSKPATTSNSVTPQCTQWAGSRTGRIQAPFKHWLLFIATKLLQG